MPSGTRRRPLRDLRRRLGRSRRYWQICAIAIRHGLGPFLRGRLRAPDAESRARLARQLREALEAGGVTFVKLGQLLSTRRDLLPAEVADELARLQDEVPPAPWAEVERVLTEELGAPPETVFAAISPEPLGAASVAQVHAARLHSGAEVVVKVQRPGIEPEVRARPRHRGPPRPDARAAHGARHDRDVHDRDARAPRLDLVALADGFATAMREELDFRVEARNLRTVAVARRTGAPARAGRPRGALHAPGAGARAPRRRPARPGRRVAGSGRRRPAGARASAARRAADADHARRALPRRPAPGQRHGPARRRHRAARLRLGRAGSTPGCASRSATS